MSGRQCLNAAYSGLGYEQGRLLSASGMLEVQEGWIDVGDHLAGARRAGSDRLFFVDDAPWDAEAAIVQAMVSSEMQS